MALEQQPPMNALRAALRADSPLREASIARGMGISCAVGIPFVLALGPLVGWRQPLTICAFLVAIILYDVAMLAALRRGWFRPWVAGFSVCLEVSVPAVIVSITAVSRGPEYAMMTPTHVVWGALVVASSLRARPRLSVIAGVIAALEWALVYAFLIHPHLPESPAPSLRIPTAVLRGVCLLMTGGFGVIFARHYVRKAEEVLQAVREQDLMGKYFLHERIGAGGMAEVFRATYCPEGGFQKAVAIKRVLPSYAARKQFVDMFREEAKLCAMLNHPNVVQVFDCGTYKDTFIVAMEYVDGLSLSQLLRKFRRPLAPSAVAYLGYELCRALDYIHKKVDAKGQPLHLVHRDVNPPNILISRIGEVKLADFGVANAATRMQTGRDDVFYGKLHYAAPEQVVAGPFDHRADLFALGLTLNEALTGRQVYGPEADSALPQGVFPRVPRPSELRPEVPPELDALLMALCEIDPDRRIQSAAEARAFFSVLRAECAPFPGGQQALSHAVEEALAREPSSAPNDEHATEAASLAHGRARATPQPQAFPSALHTPPPEPSTESAGVELPRAGSSRRS